MYGVSTKKQTTSATSCILPYLPRGIKRSISEFPVLKCEVMSVSMNPGATMLTRILRDATSLANDLVKPTSPEEKKRKQKKRKQNKRKAKSVKCNVAIALVIFVSKGSSTFLFTCILLR